MPLAEDVERQKLHSSNLDDLPAKRKESFIGLPKNRKASTRSIKDEATTSRSRDASLQRKKLRPPSATIKYSLREVSFAKKIPMRIVYSSSTTVKHLLRQLKTHDLRYKEVGSRVGSIAEKQSLSHPHQSGIKLRGLYPCPTITTCLPSHEQSSVKLIQYRRL